MRKAGILESRQPACRSARFVAAVVAGLCSVVTIASTGWTAAAQDVPPNSLVQLAPVPNFSYDPTVKPESQFGTVGTGIIADPANHLLVEYSGGGYSRNGQSQTCPQLVSFDTDSYRRVAEEPAATCDTLQLTAAYGNNPTNAIDSRDGVMFLGSACNSCNAGLGLASQVSVISEHTLSVLFTIALPGSALPDIRGVTYSPVGNELLVESDHGSIGGDAPAGLTVTDYDVAKSLGSKSGVVNWTTSVAACASAFGTVDYEQGASRSQTLPQVYVPCILTGSAAAPNPTITSDRDGIVTMSLATSGCAAQVYSCPALDASGSPVTTTTVAPTQALKDFIFDPGSDRGFMPVNQTSGMNVYVFDGKKQSFSSRFAVGASADNGQVVFGFDAATGRLYAFGKSSGTTLVDGRRTPPTAGRQFPDINGSANYLLLPVLPPDGAHPYRRFLIDRMIGNQANGCNGCALPYFTVVGDTVPLSVDPPLAAIDQNTQQLSPGDRFDTKFGGSARGYGFHSDFFGGLGGAVNNATGSPNGQGDQLPFGGNTQDLLSANVDKLGGSDSSAGGDASALKDDAGNTSNDLKNKTQGSAWPYPDAGCSYPGGKNSDSVNGATTSSGPQGGANVASAEVHCLDAKAVPGPGWEGEAVPVGSSWAEAHYQGYRQTGAGLPAVGFGPSATYTYLSPPTAKQGAVSYTYASSRGLSLDLGPAAQLHFGSAVQIAKATAAGATGTAHAERTVEVSDVTVTTGGVTQQLCSGPCASNLQAVIDKINTEFPSRIHVSYPQPDDFFFKGTPGGYEAAVQASVPQQLGDQKFNGMGSEESTYLPALRIVLYNDSSFQQNREVIDLAGVQDDAELGHEKLLDPALTLPVDTRLELAAAGFPGSSTYVADPSGDVGGGQASGQGGIGGSANGLTGLLQRAFDGFKWLFRSPGEALQVLAMLALLVSPLMVMDRRRLWIRDVFGRRSVEPAGPLDLVIRS